MDEPVPKWATSAIWAELDRRSERLANGVAQAVRNSLPIAESVLSSGDSTPGTFTLHDADHAWRVAENMARVVGPDLLAEVGPYDLAQLLLAAYLHDIGMTPPVARFTNLLTYAITGAGDALSEDDFNAFQAWCDDRAPWATIPLTDSAPPVIVVREAQSLVAAYVRARHNDWSAEWIREHLDEIDKETYQGFQADLIRLCQSHHQGIDVLRGDGFSPRLVGSPASVLHLRFDACVLRLADILDFDPERTPAILFRHRDVEQSSAIYWHKDHDLSYVIEPPRISLFARPPDALTHRAIELSVRDVDDELALCRQLDNEIPMQLMAGNPAPLPHNWRLNARVHADIKPRDDAYKYIDGTFRPDQKKILDLLGGLALYGSPIAAIRELLQNSFDAVREQIAYERLQLDDPADSDAIPALEAVHQVSITLEQTNEGAVLRCRDTGVGMSEAGLTSRFLVSGRSSDHALKALERRCFAYGFRLGRTGRFGIGVLAYFLLAARLTLSTRRTPFAPDADGKGWRFVTHGLDDFGELKEDDTTSRGTEVTLQIKASVMPDGFDVFAEHIQQYVAAVVRRVPCHFSFAVAGSNIPPLKSASGWLLNPDLEQFFVEPLESFIDRQRETDSSILSSQRREAEENASNHLHRVMRDAKDALRYETEEGPLPEQMGYYKLWLGHFSMSDEVSLVYPDLVSSNDGDAFGSIGDAFGVEIGGGVQTSWNGMYVSSQPRRATNQASIPAVIVEIDWTSDSAGILAVDRNSLTLTEQGEAAIHLVRQRAVRARSEMVRRAVGSKYALINGQVARVGFALSDTSPLWPQPENRDLRLLPLPSPSIDAVQFEPYDLSGATWKGQSLTTISPYDIVSQRVNGSLVWHQGLYSPHALALRKDFDSWRPYLIWGEPRPRMQQLGVPGCLLEFPPGWSGLLGLRIESGPSSYTTVWNQSHALVKAAEQDGWDWAIEQFRDSNDPVPVQGDLMQSPGRVAAWLCRIVLANHADLWEGLEERAPGFLGQAWSFLGLQKNLMFWDESDLRRGVFRKISKDRWEGSRNQDAADLLAQMLPDPPNDWWLTTSEGDRDFPIREIRRADRGPQN